MSIFGRLFGGKKDEGKNSDRDALWLYVQCDRCGTPLAVRVDRRHEIATDYTDGTLFLRKEMMDSKCFQLMYANIRFSASGEIIEQTVEHGRFLSRAEFERLTGKGKE